LFFSPNFRWQDRIDFLTQTPKLVYGHYCEIPILHVVPRMLAIARPLAADLVKSRHNYVMPVKLTFKSSGQSRCERKAGVKNAYADCANRVGAIVRLLRQMYDLRSRSDPRRE
jgi:hypothetical protein